MTISAKIDVKGNAEIVQDNGINPDGTKAETRWNIPASQLEKHIEMFNAGNDRQLSKGDRDAMRDAAAQFLKK